MKKTLLTLAFALTTLCASAFDFDGINLNASLTKITQEIAKRGYVYDESRDCLKGNCRGTEIYMSFNSVDVTEKGKLGQLIIEVPNKDAAVAFEHIKGALNVIYHVVAEDATASVYAVDTDDTQLVLTHKADAIIYTYNTPFYKK